MPITSSPSLPTARALSPGGAGTTPGASGTSRAQATREARRGARAAARKIPLTPAERKLQSAAKTAAEYAVGWNVEPQGKVRQTLIDAVTNLNVRMDPEVGALVTAALRPRKKESWLGGLVKNAAGDVVDIATGLPHLVALGGKTLGAAAAEPYGEAGRIVPLPGAHGAREFAKDTGEELITAGKAAGSYYRTQYGPLAQAFADVARGRKYDPEDISKTLHNVRAHPVNTALDVATVGALVGRGVGLAARAGVRAGASQEGFLGRLGDIRIVDDQTRGYAPIRERPGRVYRAPVATPESGFPEGVLVPDEIRVAQRPRSINPLTARWQKYVTDPAREYVRERIETGANALQGGRGGGAVSRYTSQGKYDRAVRRKVQADKARQVEATMKTVEELSSDFIGALKRAVPKHLRATARTFKSGTPESDAVYLHLNGYLGTGAYESGRAELSTVLDEWRRALKEDTEAATRPGGVKLRYRTKKALEQIDRLEKLPDSYLDEATMPAPLKEALDAARTLSDHAEAFTTSAGLINPKAAMRVPELNRQIRQAQDEGDAEAVARFTAERDQVEADIADAARRRREAPAGQLHGGMTFERNYVPPNPRLEALQGERAAAVENLRELRKPQPLAEIRARLNAARSAATESRQALLRGERDAAKARAAEARSAMAEVEDMIGAELPSGRVRPAGGAPSVEAAQRTRQMAILSRQARIAREQADQAAERAGTLVERTKKLPPTEVREADLADVEAIAQRYEDAGHEAIAEHMTTTEKDGKTTRYKGWLADRGRERMEREKAYASEIQGRLFGGRTFEAETAYAKARAAYEDAKGTPAEMAARIERDQALTALRSARAKDKQDVGYATLHAQGVKPGLPHESKRAKQGGISVEAGAGREGMRSAARGADTLKYDRIKEKWVPKTLDDFINDEIDELHRRLAEGDPNLTDQERRYLADEERGAQHHSRAAHIRDLFARDIEGFQDESPVAQTRRQEILDAISAGREKMAATAEELRGEARTAKGEAARLGQRAAAAERGRFTAREVKAAEREAAAGVPREASSTARSARGRRAMRRYFHDEMQVRREMAAIADDADFVAKVRRNGYLTRQEWREMDANVEALVKELEQARVQKVGSDKEIAAAQGQVTAIRKEIKKLTEDIRGSMTSPAPIGVDLSEFTNAKVQRFERAQAMHEENIARLREEGVPDGDPKIAYQERKRRDAEIAEREERIRLAGEAGHTFQAPEGARYVPEGPLDPIRAEGAPAGAGSLFSRFSKNRTYRSTGFLRARGFLDMQPRRIIYGIVRATEAVRHPEALANLIADHAYKYVDDEGVSHIAASDHAAAVFAANPDTTTLVRVSTLRQSLSHVDETAPAPGLFPELDDLRGVIAGTDAEGIVPDIAREEATFKGVRQHDPLDETIIPPEEARKLVDMETGKFREGVKASDYVAMPRAAADEWRAVSKPNQIKYFDAAQAAWKRGILAFTPRWYLYNLIGNTLQYGLMAGPDIRSIRQASRTEGGLGRLLFGKPQEGRRVADVAEARAMGETTFTHEVGGRGLNPLIRKPADIGIAFNNNLEGIIRRAAYLHQAKRFAREQGLVTRHSLARMTDDQLVKVIDEMPVALKEEALREALRFLGDYHSFTPFERGFMRRVFPFYSWMRVITRLAFTMPIRYPVRSLVVAQATRAAIEAEAPGDFARPVWARGVVRLGDQLSLPTLGLNPFSTIAEPVQAAADAWQGGASAPFRAAGGLLQGVLGQTSPALRAFSAGAYGINQLTGDPITAPLGYGGTFESFGRDPFAASGVSNSRQVERPRVPFEEQLLQMIPLAGTVPRAFLQGQDRAYDTATTWQLALNRLGLGPPNRELYLQRTNDPASAPLPYGITQAGSLLGVPLRGYDWTAEEDMLIRQLWKDLAAKRETDRRKATGG